MTMFSRRRLRLQKQQWQQQQQRPHKDHHEYSRTYNRDRSDEHSIKFGPSDTAQTQNRLPLSSADAKTDTRTSMLFAVTVSLLVVLSSTIPNAHGFSMQPQQQALRMPFRTARNERLSLYMATLSSTSATTASAATETAGPSQATSANGASSQPVTFVLQHPDRRSARHQVERIDLSDPGILHNAKCVHPTFFHDGLQYFSMTNVLGDGDCMFRAIQLGLEQNMRQHSETRSNGYPKMRSVSLSPQDWRTIVSHVLSRSSPSSTLLISDQRIATTDKLLQSAAVSEYTEAEDSHTPSGAKNKSVDMQRLVSDYLSRLRTSGANGGLYAGGPELTVLSNLLQRPIHIYECVPNTVAESMQQRPLVQFKLLVKGKNDNGSSSSGTGPTKTATRKAQSKQQSPVGAMSTATTSCSIQCVGTFGNRFGSKPNLGRKIPNWAIAELDDTSNSIHDSDNDRNPVEIRRIWSDIKKINGNGKSNDPLHILVLDVSSTEKHACLLTPRELQLSSHQLLAP